MITNQYTYNGDGQRVQVIDSQGTKKQIWDGENILLETDGAGVTQVVYTLEPAGYGNLVSQRRGSATSAYLFDALGSTRKLVNTSGSVTDSYDYRAYGETYASSGTTVNVFRWVGEVGYYFDVDRDDYYLRARPYSPALARFLSQDPIGYEGSPWNLFEYVGGSPMLSIDPTGHSGSTCLICHCYTTGFLHYIYYDRKVQCGLSESANTCCTRACKTRYNYGRFTSFDECSAKPSDCGPPPTYYDFCSKSQCALACSAGRLTCMLGCVALSGYAFTACRIGCAGAFGACFSACNKCKLP